MADTVKKRALNILAASVSDVVGQKNLAYIAIKKASDEIENSARQEWATSVFDQIPLTNRREIKSVAINKAQEEKRHVLSVRAREKPQSDVRIADLGMIWGSR
ncbi:hypothetical protein NUH88_01400 [Nisaea acidiphila]|uniref:Uncharacterized protein n=1 Tax=Nisaea acidiphila TaxID=1862145 RepID=A0A9J7AVP2_9PROT|nr:hypothetical protein [Nisaea acidiphila]UUX50356.1 hypothetical protein NUH88_01400 [Nisaea acidiphila]